jgi:hypothetical protein
MMHNKSIRTDLWHQLTKVESEHIPDAALNPPPLFTPGIAGSLQCVPPSNPMAGQHLLPFLARIAAPGHHGGTRLHRMEAQ